MFDPRKSDEELRQERIAQGITLRDEIISLRKLLAREEMPWIGLDSQQRTNLCTLIDMALVAPDVLPPALQSE